MAYIRVKPQKDTFISEKYDEYNFGNDAQLLVGSFFYNDDITGEVDYAKYRTRSLVQFDISRLVSLSSLTGSITANLVLFDNTNVFEHKNSDPFTIDIFAASLNWIEGVGFEDHSFGSFNSLNDSTLRKNASMVSNWNVRDAYNNNWSGTANVLGLSSVPEWTETSVSSFVDAVSVPDIPLIDGTSESISANLRPDKVSIISFSISSEVNGLAEWSFVRTFTDGLTGNWLNSDGTFLTGSVTSNVLASSTSWQNYSIVFNSLGREFTYGNDIYEMSISSISGNVHVKDLIIGQSFFSTTSDGLSGTLIEEGGRVSIEFDLYSGQSYDFSFSNLSHVSEGTTASLEWSLIKISDENSLRDDGSFLVLTGSTSGNTVTSISAWNNETISFTTPRWDDIYSWGSDKYRIKFWSLAGGSFVKNVFVYQSNSGSTTSVSGGAWFPSISASMQTYGFEHLVVDVTHIVNKWINGEIENNGLVIKIADHWESPSNYSITGINYFKQLTSRHSQTVYRPYLEIIYDTKIADDRGCVYKNMPQKLFLYNFLNGRLTDFDGANNFPGTVSIFEYGSTSSLTSGLPATRFAEGIYYTTFTYTGSATKLIDTWTLTSSASAMVSSITAEATVKQTYSYDSVFNVDERVQAIIFQNMKNSYKLGTVFNLRILFVYPWTSKQTLTAFYESRVSNIRVMKESWISLVDVDNGIVAVPPIPLNYDSKGNWVEIDTNMLEGNRRYVPILYYYEQGQLQRQIYNEYSFFVR